MTQVDAQPLTSAAGSFVRGARFELDQRGRLLDHDRQVAARARRRAELDYWRVWLDSARRTA